jgi:hypothetical protein
VGKNVNCCFGVIIELDKGSNWKSLKKFKNFFGIYLMQVQGYIHLCKQKSSMCRVCSCYQNQTIFFHVCANRANESRKCGAMKTSLVWKSFFYMLEWGGCKGIGKFILCVCVWANMNNRCRCLCEISKFNERYWWKHIFPHNLILNILIDPILGMF